MAEHVHRTVGLAIDAMEEQPDCKVDDLEEPFS